MQNFKWQRISYIVLHGLLASLSITFVFYFLCPCVKLTRARHSCVKTSEYIAEKTNVVWEPSKDLKHLNLKSLMMIGFEEEDKVVSYIRLVMERAVGLERIMLCGNPCEECNTIDHESPTRFEVDEASRDRIMEQLTHGSS